MVDMSKMAIPRDLQSDLHDAADRAGEQVARGVMVTITPKDGAPRPSNDVSACSCARYSMRLPNKVVQFWDEPDPDCEYVHLYPQTPKSYTVPL